VTAPSRPSSRRRELAETVAAAVDEVAGVRRTFGSGVVECSTLFPGGRVEGVALRDESVLVCVALARLPVLAVAGEVTAAARDALKALGDKRRVDVVIDDLDLEVLPALAAPEPRRRRASPRRASQ
jgi:phenylpyruvate tautomerase PptA (4-oxalocrotonate tautomerase family)